MAFDAKAYNRKWQRDNPEKVAAYNKKWAKKNPEKVRQLQRDWQRKVRKKDPQRLNKIQNDHYHKRVAPRLKENRAWVNSIKEKHGCSECYEDNPKKLHFHHPGEFNMRIGRMISQRKSRADILDEIRLCVLLCNSCHMKLHKELDKQYNF